MNFIDQIKDRAKSNMKTIVLPESEDIRVLQATDRILKEGFANIILVGKEETIKEQAKSANLDIEKAEIIDPEKSEKTKEYIEAFYELRKAKGMTLEKAEKIITHSYPYFGTMMVKMKDADGLVSGATHSTSDTLRPALQILKAAPGTKLVSGFFVMVTPKKEYGDEGVFIYADCGLNENPDGEGLSEIAISSSKSYRQLVGKEPRVAMLSYSTYGSARSELTQKVIDATKLVREKDPELAVDGELQLDAAIVPEVAKSKAPGSNVAGNANILIFPDLNSGNIGYKLTQRFGNAEAYGPLCQGLSKPVNDLSRGCSSDDIVGVVAITALQAQEQE